MADTSHSTDSPAALVAIARAARQAGDRDLERAARGQLSERFGITISFARRRESDTGNVEQEPPQ
jgi:hypothetical protein